MNDEVKPLQPFRCPNCQGRGKVTKHFHMIIKERPNWISKAPNVNDETCLVCRGTGIIQREA